MAKEKLIFKRTKEIPRIFNQHDNNSCYVYAIAGLMEYLINKHYDKPVTLDPKEFYNYMTSSGRVVKMNIALQEAKNRGLKDISGKLHKISDYTRIARNEAWETVKYQPVLLGVDLEMGESLKDRLDGSCVVHRRQYGWHAVVGMELINNMISVANSWGVTFGDAGYFYVPRVVEVNGRPFITEAYIITV